MQTIFFDEAGFTGPNLLDKDQQHFAFAGVAITEEQAQYYIDKVQSDFSLDTTELKASSLLRSTKGQRAIESILHYCLDKSQILVANKKFSLACNIFEYAFEPLIASNSYAFYNIGFHKFIANLLFFEFRTGNIGAEQIFEEFQSYIRSGDIEQAKTLFIAGESISSNEGSVGQILDIIYLHREKVVSEINFLQDNSKIGKWVLDLSLTSLNGILSFWGTKFDKMLVYCDESKPLADSSRILDVMIGRTDKQFIELDDETQPLTFNLAEPIRFLDSANSPGIQIADVLAGAICASLKKPEHRNWFEMAESEGAISKYSILPNLDAVDIRKKRTQLNAVLLHELHVRAIDGDSLLEGISDCIALISERLETDPPALGF